MTGSFLLLASTIGSAFLIGFIPALLGRLRPALAQGLGVAEAKVDQLKTIYLLSLIPFMGVAGIAVDRWGAKEVLFTGNLLAVVGIASLGLKPSMRSPSWVVLVLGAAASCLTCAGLTLMPKAFWGEAERAASLNLGFLAIGVGALVIPVLCDFFLKRIGFPRCMLLLAFLTFIPAACTVFTGQAEFPETRGAADSSELLTNLVLWIAALGMLSYFPLEASLHTWVKSYLANLNYDESSVSRWHALFWLVFLAARLGAGLYLDPRYEAWLIFALVLVSAITLGNLAGAFGRTSAWQLLLIGVTLGSILPTFLGLVLRGSNNPESVWQLDKAQGTVLGILFSLGTLSSLVMRPVLTRLARSHSVQVAIRVPLALALALAVTCLILALIR
jgi:fucose permease